MECSKLEKFSLTMESSKPVWKSLFTFSFHFTNITFTDKIQYKKNSHFDWWLKQAPSLKMTYPLRDSPLNLLGEWMNRQTEMFITMHSLLQHKNKMTIKNQQVFPLKPDRRNWILNRSWLWNKMIPSKVLPYLVLATVHCYSISHPLANKFVCSTCMF